MIPFLPVYIEDLDKVGQLHDEPVKVSRLDEEVIAGREVESLGRGGGCEVDLRRTAGSVPLQVHSRAPVEGLEFSLQISKRY